MLPLAEQIEQAAHAATVRAGGEAASVEGVVRLAIFEGFTFFLAKRLGPLRDRHPALVVEVLASTRVLDLSRGEADLAVRTARTSQPSLLIRKLGTAGWGLYAAPEYLARRGTPASLDDLTGQDVIGFDEALSAMPGAVWLGPQARGARVVMRGNGIAPVLQAALAGMGLAALPCMVACVEPGLVRVAPDVLAEADIQLVAHLDTARTARVRAVMDFLGEITRRDVTVLSGRR